MMPHSPVASSKIRDALRMEPAPDEARPIVEPSERVHCASLLVSRAISLRSEVINETA